MCLRTRNERKIAEEDIVVYKILRKFTDLDKNEVIYEPPYQYYWGGFTYKQGINSAGNEFEQVNGCYDILGGDYICVEGGFLHAFMEKPYAFAHRNWNFENITSPNYTLEYNVYKMVIPKGTEYFVGSYHDICAKALLWEDMTPCEEFKRICV